MSLHWQTGSYPLDYQGSLVSSLRQNLVTSVRNPKDTIVSLNLVLNLCVESVLGTPARILLLLESF